MRNMARSPVCEFDRSYVANELNGVCPCGGSLTDHQKGAFRRRTAVAVAKTAADAVLTRRAEATLGAFLSPAEILHHPESFTLQKWGELLSSIRGRSAVNQRLDHMRENIRKDGLRTKDGIRGQDGGTGPSVGEYNLRDCVYRCDLPGGKVREFAGLLASMSAVAQANVGTPVITVPRDALCEGDVGRVSAEVALNDVSVHRLLREGRSWFLAEVLRLRESHRGDAVQYVKTDSKDVKRALSWVDRYAKLLFQSYELFLQSRPPTWVPEDMHEYLRAPWGFPNRDTAGSLDMTGVFVQIGVLSMVHQCEAWTALGDSILSIRAHVAAAFDAFQTKFVLCSANLTEHKALRQKAPPVSVPGRGDRGGRVGGRGQPPGVITPSGIPLHSASTGVIGYNRCHFNGCTSVPPGGISLFKYCDVHRHPPRQTGPPGGLCPLLPPTRFGGRGGGRRGGGRF
jgi:hypothetical protein